MARAARSLDAALAQLNALAPRRSKKSDGGEGDAAHKRRISDHNPDKNGIYHARDFTHDPGNGADMRRMPMALMMDSRAKYVIFEDVFYDRDDKGRVRRRPYPVVNPSRTNEHNGHLHLSVVSGSAAEDERLWGAFTAGTGAVPPMAGATGLPTLSHGESGDAVKRLQAFMTRVFPDYNKYEPSGYYGDMTAAGIAEFQHRNGITGPSANGRVVGPRTKEALYRAGWRG